MLLVLAAIVCFVSALSSPSHNSSTAQISALEHTMSILTTEEQRLEQLMISLNQKELKMEQLISSLAQQEQKVEQMLSSPATQDPHLKQTIESLTRQVMLQQLFIEEKIRTDGNSGLKEIRQTISGTKPYYGQSFSPSIAAMHEHSNNDRTVGMGELNVVMNGVDFRTRHNDYRLKMPSKTSSAYELVENIPFPEVPPAVLHKSTVDEQIIEMREWCKAWHDLDHSKKDYRPYFKAVMCYLEGAWTTDTTTLKEPFHSDRHHIDATSWFDLQEKIRFTSYTGAKSNKENYAYLPTTIMNIHDGIPEFSQWNYRILCHPIKQDLPHNVFNPVDDLKVRLVYKKTLPDILKTRSARFSLTDRIYLPYHRHYDRRYREGLLDSIMKEIPGKDNYRGNISDTAFGMTAFDVSAQQKTALNTAYYHRFYKTDDKDAMGVKYKKRGFNDDQLFVAGTTQPRVSPMSVTDCQNIRKHNVVNGHTHYYYEKECKTYTDRVSYAIPLEIIYLTPLAAWNPYDLEHKGEIGHGNHLAPTVTANHRNGGLDASTAYNGTNSKIYYRTPVEFFTGAKAHTDAADTTKGLAGVLDRHGNVRKVVASGTRIMLPNIPGVGEMRTRFPIMPVHADGDPVYKELKALEELVLHHTTYKKLIPEHTTTGDIQSDAELRTSYTRHDPPGGHLHEIFVPRDDYETFVRGNPIKVTTEISNGHDHEMVLVYNNVTHHLSYTSCDGVPICWDEHPTRIIHRHAPSGFSTAALHAISTHHG